MLDKQFPLLWTTWNEISKFILEMGFLFNQLVTEKRWWIIIVVLLLSNRA